MAAVVSININILMLCFFSSVDFHHVVSLYGHQHRKFPNKQTNIAALTFVYYSVSATWFDTTRSLSGSFHVMSLVIELCSNMDLY
jgi:hypothetical protein